MKKFFKKTMSNIEGRVAPPIILYLLGVPGTVCVALWAVFWRGK